MCYICATNAGNTILRAHYAFMAHRNGMPIRQLATATNTESSEDVAADDTIDAKQVCLSYVCVCVFLIEIGRANRSLVSTKGLGLCTDSVGVVCALRACCFRKYRCNHRKTSRWRYSHSSRVFMLLTSLVG